MKDGRVTEYLGKERARPCRMDGLTTWDGDAIRHDISVFFVSAIQSAAIITQTMKKRCWLSCGGVLGTFS